VRLSRLKTSWKMTERYDLHTHLFTTWEKGRYSLERQPRSPERILSAIRRAGLDGIVLVNFADSRYEKFADEALKEPISGFSFVKSSPNALTFADDKGYLRVIKGQEIPTPDGHVLAVATDYGQSVANWMRLVETSKAIRNNGAISCADHFSGRMGVGTGKLVENPELFDTFEGINQNYARRVLKPLVGINLPVPMLNKISCFTGLNWIAVSDSHNLGDIGTGHIMIQGGLDFSGADNLRGSLKEVLSHQEKFVPVDIKPNAIGAILAHAFIANYDSKIREPRGWLGQKNAD